MPTTQGPDGGAYLRATLEGGRVLIEGALPDAAVAAELGALAELIYAPLLDNRLIVDETLETASWVSNDFTSTITRSAGVRPA